MRIAQTATVSKYLRAIFVDCRWLTSFFRIFDISSNFQSSDVFYAKIWTSEK